jgi:hypothetical protein
LVGGTVIDRDRIIVLEEHPILNASRIHIERSQIGAPGRPHVHRLVGNDVINKIVGRQTVVVIHAIKMGAKFKLLQIIQACDALGLVPGFCQGRKQQRRENADDGDHDKQFDEGERRFSSYGSRLHGDGQKYSALGKLPLEFLTLNDSGMI